MTSAVADRDERVALRGRSWIKTSPLNVMDPGARQGWGISCLPCIQHPAPCTQGPGLPHTLLSFAEKLSSPWAMTTCSGTQVSAFPRKSAPNQGSSSHRVPGPLPGAGQAQGTLQMGGAMTSP